MSLRVLQLLHNHQYNYLAEIEYMHTQKDNFLSSLLYDVTSHIIVHSQRQLNTRKNNAKKTLQKAALITVYFHV